MYSYKREKFPRIKDVFPITNGIFGHVNYTFPEYLTISKAQLDYLFMASYAQKNTAPVIDLLHDEDAGETPFSQLTSAELQTLADMMVAYYKQKWDKLGEIYDIEYDPIHNYLDQWEDEADGTRDTDVTIDREIEDRLNTTIQHTNLRTDNLSELETRNLANSSDRSFTNYKERTDYHSGSDHVIDANNPMVEATEYGKTDERTDDLTTVNTGQEVTANSGTDTNAIWGFNSGNAVNSDSTTHGLTSTRTITGNNPLTEEVDGTVTHALSGTDTKTSTGKYSDNKTGYDESSKSGEINDDGTETGTVTTANTGTQSSAGSDATTGTNVREFDETNNTDEATHNERSGRHFGNIGNLTSQKMIKEEIELWKWNYIQSILEDARDFLTLPVYM